MISNSKIINPQALVGIFGKFPNFLDSELIDIHINCFNKSVKIRLVTKEEVKERPKRWGEWDVVYVDFIFYDVKELRLYGDIEVSIVKSLEICDLNNECSLELLCSNDFMLKGRFEWARVENITPGLIE